MPPSILLEPTQIEVFKLVLEDLIRPFRFINGNTLYTGMTFEQKLYHLYQSFQGMKRGQALDRATELTKRGVPVVVTVSPKTNFYQIWVDLRFITQLDLATDQVNRS